MNQNKIIKLAGAIKPPARKSEIIEALAIRKRAQIIEENAKLLKELEQLKLKGQVVAAEEAIANAKPKKAQHYYLRVDKQNDGRLEVRSIGVDYTFEPSQELRTIARRIYALEHMNLYHQPSLHEVRQQVRAAVLQQTPPDGRVNALLKDAESSQMIDSILEKLNGTKAPLALVG